MRDDPNGIYPSRDPYSTTTTTTPGSPWVPPGCPLTRTGETGIVTEPSGLNGGYTSLAGIYRGESTVGSVGGTYVRIIRTYCTRRGGREGCVFVVVVGSVGTDIATGCSSTMMIVGTVAKKLFCLERGGESHKLYFEYTSSVGAGATYSYRCNG